jgi:hypothetical protein
VYCCSGQHAAKKRSEHVENLFFRSPSTRNGERLELLCYAFEWAAPDVLPVMKMLCTEDGKPGRVVEITLAASSL